MGITLYDISRPDDVRLRQAYALYQHVFVLEEEREPFEAFQAVLSMNQSLEVQASYGPLQEMVAVALDCEEVVGLANYIIYAYPDSARREYGGSCQLNFVCVDKRRRGEGIAPRLLSHVESQLVEFVADHTGKSDLRTFITIEQNDPTRMTAEQLESDRLAAGIAPESRTRWWARQGYRRLDFPYRQPALRPGVEACTYLNYFARLPGRGAHRRSIPAQLLAEHLRRFFYVSVGKSAVDMGVSSDWLEQKALLETLSEVALVD